METIPFLFAFPERYGYNVPSTFFSTWYSQAKNSHKIVKVSRSVLGEEIAGNQRKIFV